jgi:pimeloyl-ACP methyl ester carboxylesterase
VSIDGFGPGMITLGSDADTTEFRAYQGGLRDSFMAMTSPPESGDRTWRDAQVELLCQVVPQVGYTAPNVRAMVERSFVELGGGQFQRRPPRHLFTDAFDDDGDKDILRMYRGAKCPTLIIRCTQSGAPDTLDAELTRLVADNPLVEVSRLPLTHMAPAWDAIDEVVDELERFLASHPVPV